MSSIRFVTLDALPNFLSFLSQKAKLLMPTLKPAVKNSIVFEEWHEGKEYTLVKATVPAKAATFPQSEVLFNYKREKNTETGQTSVKLLENLKADPTIVFACRPCDTRGYLTFDRPYLHGPIADPYYKAKRENLTVFTYTCNSGCDTCFCHWVGSGPTDQAGSDVLITAIDEGLVLQGISEKGKALLESSSLADGTDRFPKVEEVRKKAWQSLVKAPDLTQAKDKLAALFNDVDFWIRETDRCLSCGACTYFCPTCYCFNITDEGFGLLDDGKRIRSWDSCMSPLFTREASGHNPRLAKALRMRNRVSHKFSTYPENWGVFSCNGCGRCISNCPVCLDIRAIVLDAINA